MCVRACECVCAWVRAGVPRVCVRACVRACEVRPRGGTSLCVCVCMRVCVCACACVISHLIISNAKNMKSFLLIGLFPSLFPRVVALIHRRKSADASSPNASCVSRSSVRSIAARSFHRGTVRASSYAEMPGRFAYLCVTAEVHGRILVLLQVGARDD